MASGGQGVTPCTSFDHLHCMMPRLQHSLSVMLQLVPFEGPVWRLLPEQFSATPEAPASAPEGRFHHSGQIAAYASLSIEGARVAIQRYLADGVPRVLVPMWLSTVRVADVRGVSDASIVWQDMLSEGKPSPTWRYSDLARDAGAEAMLYSSRSRPELSHIVIFQPHKLRPRGPISQFEN